MIPQDLDFQKAMCRLKGRVCVLNKWIRYQVHRCFLASIFILFQINLIQAIIEDHLIFDYLDYSDYFVFYNSLFYALHFHLLDFEIQITYVPSPLKYMNLCTKLRTIFSNILF